MFASNHHHSHRQAHGKKLWLDLGALKCNQDLNHALDSSAKEKKKEKSTRVIKYVLKMI
jgi:hypothetical protein